MGMVAIDRESGHGRRARLLAIRLMRTEAGTILRLFWLQLEGLRKKTIFWSRKSIFCAILENRFENRFLDLTRIEYIPVLCVTNKVGKWIGDK